MNPAALRALLEGNAENFTAATTPGGIEAQETAGQREFVRSETLPREFLHCTHADFEALGFVFGEPIDDLFIACTFPTGWSKRPTDHSMWSEIVDGQGRVRAMVFYKAAFYDRRAHVGLHSRYDYGTGPVGGYGAPQPHDRWYGYVKDAGKIIWQTAIAEGDDYQTRDQLRDQAKTWLETNYPDYRNVLAYWEDR